MKTITEHELNLLDWKEVTAIYQKRCMTSSGRDLYNNLEELEISEAKLCTTRIDEIRDSIINGLSMPLTPIFNIIKPVMLAYKGSVLCLEEIYQISRTVKTINEFCCFLDDNKKDFASLMPLRDTLTALPIIEKELTSAITDDVLLNETKYPQIGKLHREIDSIKNEIKSRLQQLVNSPEFSDHVQERIVTTAGNKYVILLKSSSRGKIPGTIIDTSSSGATFYFEPKAASELNNRLLSRENDLNRELFTIMKSLSETAGSCADVIGENLKIIAYMDFLHAAAKTAIDHDFNSVSYTNRPELNLINAAHPLLYTESPVNTVRNTISLGKDHRGIIITGANTGGKTILLKTTAILILLARCGLPIPASADSIIGKYETICVDIGDDQNLQKSLSTFSGQIVSLNSMIKKCDSSSLLIIDEIISGTNPRHAASLAMAVLEFFELRGVPVIISTHYPELKEFASKSNYYTNASVSFDVDSLSPTYRLNIGTPGTSYAFEIARIYQLEESIIDRATRYLSENEIISDQTIEKVNRLEHELIEKKQQAEKLEKSLNKQRENYYELNEKLRQKIENIKEEASIDYLKQLETWKSELATRISSIQQLSMKESQQLIETISEQSKTVIKNSHKFKEKRATQDYHDFDPESAQIGSQVFIIPLEKKAKLLEINEQKREVVVALGASIKSRFSFDKIKLCDTNTIFETSKPVCIQTNAQQVKSDETILTIQNEHNSVDLRGMRASDAIMLTEQRLDSMLKSGIPAAVIIHGHGTGALKNAIRDYLSSCSFVTLYRPGGSNEGGDGVTIAYL